MVMRRADVWHLGNWWYVTTYEDNCRDGIEAKCFLKKGRAIIHAESLASMHLVDEVWIFGIDRRLQTCRTLEDIWSYVPDRTAGHREHATH
jgi:hypothetical protein